MSSDEFSGRMRECLTIERTDPARDALGGASADFLTVGTVWAAITADDHSADDVAESRSALPRWRIKLRDSDRIMIGDMLVWNTRRLTVVRIERSVGIAVRMTIIAEEVR